MSRRNSKGRPDPLDRADTVRRSIIHAIFADDTLFERLALKGGNALRLAYGIQSRASLDLDISLEGHLEDVIPTGERLIRLLNDRLDSAGYALFDGAFESKGDGVGNWWGGYLLTFKLIEKDQIDRLGKNLDAMRRESVIVGQDQRRTWRVEISRGEHLGGSSSVELDQMTIRVYSPVMIVIEKLRAICQQMDGYPHRAHRTPRARDFFDIFTLLQSLVSVEEIRKSTDLAKRIFDAKRVALDLLWRIPDTRDFHSTDWPDVVSSVAGELQPFDFYFDFVVDLVEQLKSVWIEDLPST